MLQDLILYSLASCGVLIVLYLARPVWGILLIPLWVQSTKRLQRKLDQEFDVNLDTLSNIAKDAQIEFAQVSKDIETLGFEHFIYTRNKTFDRYGGISLSSVWRSTDQKVICYCSYIKLPPPSKKLQYCLGRCAEILTRPSVNLGFESVAADHIRVLTMRMEQSISKLPPNYSVVWLKPTESVEKCYQEQQRQLETLTRDRSIEFLNYSDSLFYLQEQRKQRAELAALR